MEKREFCIYCNAMQEYTDKRIKQICILKDEEYEFVVTRPICKKCGEDLGLPNYIDLNRDEVFRQYRDLKDLVQIEDINNLMNLYDLGKLSLSRVLDFGDITVTRYLEGQIPSKTYSKKIKKALASPTYMLRSIKDSRDKLSAVAYEKAIKAAEALVSEFAISSKMLGAIAVITDCLGEITPMALQKLLYYSDGLFAAKCNRPMFADVCEAWKLGPVYHETYRMIKCLPSDIKLDAKYSIIKSNACALSDDEESIIRLVANTFGKYSALTLSSITHKELPWKNARIGYEDGEWSNESINKQTMETYFADVDKKFGINQAGLDRYIKSML